MIGLFIQKFKTLIYRRVNFVLHHWRYLHQFYRQFSYPLRSLQNCDSFQTGSSNEDGYGRGGEGRCYMGEYRWGWAQGRERSQGGCINEAARVCVCVCLQPTPHHSVVCVCVCVCVCVQLEPPLSLSLWYSSSCGISSSVSQAKFYRFYILLPEVDFTQEKKDYCFILVIF